MPTPQPMPSSTPAEYTPTSPTILNKSTPEPPAPAKKVEEISPNSQAFAVAGDKAPPHPRAEAAEPNKAAATEPAAKDVQETKEFKKAERKPAEKRRIARSRRQRYAADSGPPPAPAQKQGVISQIPIVGPVVGLVLPF